MECGNLCESGTGAQLPQLGNAGSGAAQPKSFSGLPIGCHYYCAASKMPMKA